MTTKNNDNTNNFENTTIAWGIYIKEPIVEVNTPNYEWHRSWMDIKHKDVKIFRTDFENNDDDGRGGVFIGIPLSNYWCHYSGIMSIDDFQPTAEQKATFEKVIGEYDELRIKKPRLYVTIDNQ